MFLLLTLLILTPLASAATNCANGDQLECQTSLCYNYYYNNGSCTINTTSACTTGQVFSGGSCVTCSGLTMATCHTCPNWIWHAMSSVSSSCVSCSSLYGANCIRCTSSACTACALSSNMVLASNGLSCVNSMCTVANCVECYSGGGSCYRCQSGYVTASNYTCIPATCSVSNCITCSGALCLNCFPDYSLNNAQDQCNPLCHGDQQCVTCIAPNVCGTCNSPYSPDSTGKCVITNCSSVISNCLECSSEYHCTLCDSTHTLVEGGQLCQLTCTVANCKHCSQNASACESCTEGYDLANSTSCVASFCTINYCMTCASVQTCSACITGFSLSSTNTTCTSDCPAGGFNNCLFCTQSACILCDANYALDPANTGQCVLPCASITNCIACSSSSVCSACMAGYSVSSTGTTCDIVCAVEGCLTCTSATATTCTTCKTGYTPYNDTNSNQKCAKNCADGEVDVGSGAVQCQACDTTIQNCHTCSVHNSVVFCDACFEEYFVNGAHCDLCSNAIANCLACTSATTCTTCASGYDVYNGACTNTACAGSVTNCHTCSPTNSAVCVACEPGFSLANGACTSITCSNSFIFDQATNACACPPGTYLSSGSCLPCTDGNCLACTASICTACSNEYYPSGATCAPCMQNCEICLSASSCSQCEEDYSVDSTGACVSYGLSSDVTISQTGTVLKCQTGCSVCAIDYINTDKTICLIAKAGYSIIAGKLVKCATSCKSCNSASASVCTSCYSSHALVSGTCMACTDPNALNCSSLNVSYSTSCKSGYTSVYFTGSTAGTCSACAQYCKKCNNAGPGFCDANGCDGGAVQVAGTANCSLCFSGCVTCSATDPTTCLACGPLRYLDANSECQSCQLGCKTCTTSASNCQSCTVGYWLVSSVCIIMPANCAVINSTGHCQSCFGGYVVNSAANTCDADTNCNSNSSCTVCAEGYYLTGGQCTACTLGANCVACDPNTPANCLFCASGYYLDGSSACQVCTTNCLTCDSATFCKTASPGYFVPLSDTGAASGSIAQCLSPCATCKDYSDFCESCITGYSLSGSVCTQTNYLLMTIIFGPGTGINPIFIVSDPPQTQLSNGIKSFNRIGGMLNAIAPAGFKSDGFTGWRKRFIFKAMAIGSIVTTVQANGGTYTTSSGATSAMTNALSSTPIDGMSYLSSSMVGTGFSTSSGSSSNLGLVLGLTIPLVILLILVIIILVKTRCGDQEEETQGNKYTKAGPDMYSDDYVNKETPI